MHLQAPDPVVGLHKYNTGPWRQRADTADLPMLPQAHVPAGPGLGITGKLLADRVFQPCIQLLGDGSQTPRICCVLGWEQNLVEGIRAAGRKRLSYAGLLNPNGR